MNDTSLSLRPHVTVVLSDPALGTYLVENLLSNFCEVSLIVSDVEYWRTKLKHLSENKNLKISNISILIHAQIDYLVLSKDYFKNETQLTELSKINNHISDSTVVLTILPYFTESSEDKRISLKVFENFSFVQNLKTVFLGDLFGPRMVLGGEEFSEKLRQLLYDGNVVVGGEQYYFPTYAPLAARQIVKSLFSFGVREGVFYYSHQIKESEIPSYFKKYFPNLVFKKTRKESRRQFFNVEKRFLIETPLAQAYYETFKWFSVNLPEIKKTKVVAKELQLKTTPIKLKKTNLSAFNKKLWISLLTVLIFPFALEVFSILTLVLGVDFITKADTKKATYMFNISKNLNSVSNGVFLLYSKVPVVGPVFNSTYSLSSMVSRISETAINGVTFYETSSFALNNILQKQDFDTRQTASNLSSLAKNIYIDLGFIQSEGNSLGLYSRPFNSALGKVNIESLREKLLIADDFFALLPEILGGGKQKTYMVLFQNNMEIRPTGGFIGSFALVNFNKSKFVDFEVYDVYDADGQLKGYVASPDAIRVHLGEPAWYLRDANWDPDFPSSAAKIEWFLQKELGRSVDGVIGIDLSVARSLVSGVGNVYLPDYSKDINVDNFYLETQNAAESNFFPGSDKKRNFLTALTRAILLKVTENGIKNKINLAKNLLADIDGRHIQIALSDRRLQDFVKKAGLDGSMEMPSCPIKNCHSDFLALVDANVGVNKANYYIQKSINLDVREKNEFLETSLKINYVNSAPINSQNTYKNYLRIVVPAASEISYVEINGERANFDVNDVSGRREVGVLMEVLENSESFVDFVWTQKLEIETGEGEYQFLIRKQAGTDDDLLGVNFALSGVVSFDSGMGALTNGGAYSYNTNLSRDILTRIKINK